MIKMLLIGCCYSIRSERRLCQEFDLNLAYGWFFRLSLEDNVNLFPYFTFLVNV